MRFSFAETKQSPLLLSKESPLKTPEWVSPGSQLIQFCYTCFNNLCVGFHFFRCVPRRTEGIANLVRGELREQMPNPSNVGTRNVIANPAYLQMHDQLG